MTATLIVSDIHLGAHNSQRQSLLGLLQTPFERLILNGDTVDNLNLKRFGPDDWAVLTTLQEVAQERELILIRGNHEGTPDGRGRLGPLDVLSRLLKVPLQEEYPLSVGRRRYLVLHGDQFDSTMNLTRVGYAAEGFYKLVQRWSRPTARWLKSCVKHYCGVVGSVQRGAIEYARQKSCDGVITGHTHYHDDELVDGMHYLNTGCWVDWPCTYLLVKNGQVNLCRWDDATGQEVLSNRQLAAQDTDHDMLTIAEEPHPAPEAPVFAGSEPVLAS
jgi:UDP-2,3-diacylglucosamine pyrophosphatase LpxH